MYLIEGDIALQNIRNQLPHRRWHSPSEHQKPVTKHKALHFRRLESLIITLKNIKIHRVSL